VLPIVFGEVTLERGRHQVTYLLQRRRGEARRLSRLHLHACRAGLAQERRSTADLAAATAAAASRFNASRSSSSSA
jgi:hypothetical protein